MVISIFWAMVTYIKYFKAQAEIHFSIVLSFKRDHFNFLGHGYLHKVLQGAGRDTLLDSAENVFIVDLVG